MLSQKGRNALGRLAAVVATGQPYLMLTVREVAVLLDVHAEQVSRAMIALGQGVDRIDGGLGYLAPSSIVGIGRWLDRDPGNLTRRQAITTGEQE